MFYIQYNCQDVTFHFATPRVKVIFHFAIFVGSVVVNPMTVFAAWFSFGTSLTHEAIKQFLATERGKQMLDNMDGGTSDRQFSDLTSLLVMKPAGKPSDELISLKNGTGIALSDDCGEILSSILK